MSIFWIAVACVAFTPVGDVSSNNASSDNAASGIAAEEVRLVAFRTGTELRDAAREALRRWANVSDKDAMLAAGELLVLYRELQADADLARSVREPLRGKLRSRLMGLSTQIKTRAAVERRLAREKKPDSERVARSDSTPGSAEVPKSAGPARQHEVLGQFGFSGSENWSSGMQGAFGGAAGPGDYGEDLVDLIQQTISPRTWDVNGGPGAIYYWQPGRAMVVTAPGEVHNEIADLLEQMGKMWQ